MADILTFCNGVWISFSNLGIFQKCVVAGIFGYGVLKVTTDFGKKLLITMLRLKWKKRKEPTDPSYDPNKIYLHMFYRKITKQVPNLSPFVIKLETWMRMKDIKYEAVETKRFSKGTTQIPYIYHQGKEINDSDLIIEYLENENKLDPTEGLSPQDQASSRAIIKMSEESLAPTIFTHRYIYKLSEFRRIYSTPFSNPIGAAIYTATFPSVLRHAMFLRGIGRKSPAEVYHIGQEDIGAISKYLGTKSFMMGDKITKVDCAIFGLLSQVVFVDFHYPHMDYIKEHCQNLLPYMDRIRDQYWPDWDTIVSKGHFF